MRCAPHDSRALMRAAPNRRRPFPGVFLRTLLAVTEPSCGGDAACSNTRRSVNRSSVLTLRHPALEHREPAWQKRGTEVRQKRMAINQVYDGNIQCLGQFPKVAWQIPGRRTIFRTEHLAHDRTRRQPSGHSRITRQEAIEQFVGRGYRKEKHAR